ncbi:MAG: hypothetical protein JJ850_02675 [Kordiimonadaceae bacterium]|nr:hypothetical protein [Kordiimonadaceae bacterium]MBO6567289.1 hypothetical protein [Kordiimonadaceae bacterium]MBO6963497.1 hypothetical protein [Kordiimonadaceae bacterium]
MYPAMRGFVLLLVVAFAGPALGQQTTGQEQTVPNRDPRFVDSTRGNIPIPTNPEELRGVSLELWLKFRRTNQSLYRYIKEAAEFRAYAYSCKRHDLNVNFTQINALVSRHLQQILLAHYEEPDYAVLEDLSKEKQADLMADMAADVYGFEYGYQMSAQRTLIEQAGATTNNYCVQAEDNYYGKYISLLRTARREIGAVQQ